jgi:hypothetical protein
MNNGSYHGPVPDPTPDEIAERIAAIRQGWTAEDERRRSVIKNRPWHPPVSRVGERNEA